MVPKGNDKDSLPLAKVGNFTYAEYCSNKVSTPGRRASVMRRKSISVDSTTGQTTTTSLDIDAYLTSDGMGQILYEDVGML